MASNPLNSPFSSVRFSLNRGYVLGGGPGMSGAFVTVADDQGLVP